MTELKFLILALFPFSLNLYLHDAFLSLPVFDILFKCEWFFAYRPQQDTKSWQ